jgi:hypothetical protein
MKPKPHIERLLEAFNKLPSSERKAYSILSAINEVHTTKENADPKPVVREFKRAHTHSLDLLHTVTFDEPLSGSDVFGEMSEINLSSFDDSLGFNNILFISDIQAANDMGLLRKNQINSILTLGQSNKPMTYPSVRGGYRCVPLEDSDKADLLKHMDNIFSFIDSQLARGNVLVHCMRGKNRSCAAVIAFIMKKFFVSYEEAERAVKEARPMCVVQSNFVKQLNSSRWKNTYM